MLPPSDCEVLVIGAGIAGCNAALHLIRSGVRGVVLLESGSAGDGIMVGTNKPEHSYTREGDSDDIQSIFTFANRSGSAVLPNPVGTIKQIINLYPCSSKEFVSHHGKVGARRYLELAWEGIKLEKSLALEALDDFDTEFRSLGSLYVTDSKQMDELKEEYNLLVEILEDCDAKLNIEWWDKEKVESVHGKEAGFTAGIFFPSDAIINSASYCKSLINMIIKESKLNDPTGNNMLGFQFFPNTKISSIDNKTHNNYVYTKCEIPIGLQIRSKYVVLATGGLFIEPGIAGILTPCWSYLVGIPLSDKGVPITGTGMSYPNSPNFFTWGYTHDWCMSNGYLRISGEDHFSAMKPPRMDERCEKLAEWGYEKYPYLKVFDGLYIKYIRYTYILGTNFKSTKDQPIEYFQQYGVYSETPDHCPIVGKPNLNSRICYLMGCNAWGQASLTYAASLVPGLLGYVELNEKQQDLYRILTIKRFSLLPVLRS